MNCFTKPEFKKQFYISRTENPIISNLIDCKIKSIVKMKNDKGYTMQVCIQCDDKHMFQDIDASAMHNLIHNNNTWFNNNLTEDEIRQLFRAAICEQSNTITLLLNDKTKIYVNDKSSELTDFLSHDMSYFRHCMLNIKAQHLGLYIYSKQTLNRWYINSLYLYDQEIDIENKEDIDDTWHNLVSEAIDNLNHQIQTLEDKKTRINMLYQDIHKNYRNRQWDTQIQELKKIIQNIIF